MEISVRNKILEILVKPSTVTEVKNKLPKVKSLGTVAYHLKQLENESVITKDKDKNAQGQPTTYRIISGEILKRIQKNRDERLQMRTACLKIQKEKPHISDGQLRNELEEQGFDGDLAADEIFEVVGDKMATRGYTITPKGDKFLKQHGSKKTH